jgi:hypothetical protein
MKFFSTQILNQIYNDRFIAVDLLELHLRNAQNNFQPLYLTNSNFDIVYDSPTAPNIGSNTYTAEGEFLSFSSVSEEFDVKVGKFNIFLSAINNDYLNRFTVQEIEGQRVVIYKAFLEYNTGVVIPNPVMLFDGEIMNLQVTESTATCSLNLDCSTLFVDFERTMGRMTNNTSNWVLQRNKYDVSMEKSGWVGNSEIAWGRKK